MKRPKSGWPAVAVVALTVAAVSCVGGSTGRRTATQRISPSVAASPACLAVGAPATPTGLATSSPVWTAMSGLDQPDDLLYRGGQLYVGELGAGRIDLLAWGATARALPAHIPSVEGMAFIGGQLYAADQNDDRVVAVTGGLTRTVFQLSPVPGVEGVDDIAAAGDLLIVPDSARGSVDWITADGRVVRSVGGFARPTAAWPEPGGSVLVADENGGAIIRITPNGGRSQVGGSLPVVDDVVEDPAGRVFAVTALARAALSEITGAGQDLVSGLREGQGLALDGAGNVFVSEEQAGRVDLVIRTFKLIPVPPGRPRPGQPLCIRVRRAPGYSLPITFSGSAGLEIVGSPGTGDQGTVMVRDCRSHPCTLTATSGSSADTLELQTAT